MNIGDRIKSIRKKAGLRQDEFADRLMVSQHTIINYEKGKRPPDANFISKLILKFNVSADWLFTGKGEQFFTNALNKSTDTLTNQMIEYMENIPEIRYAIVAEFQKAITIFESKVKDYEENKKLKKRERVV